jgi:hypothetical protein
MAGMNTADHLHDSASGLVEAAGRFQAAAEQPGSHTAAPGALACLEEALQELSAAWYRLAADASPTMAERRRGPLREARSHPPQDGLSREQEVNLVGRMHDVAGAFAGCARACRVARSTAEPIIAGAARAAA